MSKIIAVLFKLALVSIVTIVLLGLLKSHPCCEVHTDGCVLDHVTR